MLTLVFVVDLFTLIETAFCRFYKRIFAFSAIHFSVCKVTKNI